MTSQSGQLKYYILLYGKAVPNTATGYNTVSIKEVLAATTSGSSFYLWTTTASGTVNGGSAFTATNKPSEAWDTKAFTEDGVAYESSTVIGEGSVSIDCTDGAVHSISLVCKWKFTADGTTYTPEKNTERTVSVTATLSAIRRNTILDSVTCSTNYVDGTYTYKYTPFSSSHYNALKIYCKVGETYTQVKSIMLGQKAAQQQTGAVAFSDSELTDIKNQCTTTSNPGIYFQLTTYENSAYSIVVGSHSNVLLSLSLPTDSGPAATLTTSPSNTNTWLKSKSVYVAGYSGLTASLSGSAGTGATMTSYSITSPWGNGTTSLSVTTLQSAGTFTVSGTVANSRGQSDTKTSRIIVKPYAPPAVQSLLFERGTYSSGSWSAGEDGLDLKVVVKLALALSDISNRGSITFKFNGTTKTPSAGSTTSLVSGSEYTYYFVNVSNETTYSMAVTPTDPLGTSGSDANITIPTASITMDFRADGTGIAFGKAAETSKLLDCAWDAKIGGKFQAAGEAEFSGHAAFNSATNFNGSASFNGGVTLPSAVKTDILVNGVYASPYDGDCWATKDALGLVQLQLRFTPIMSMTSEYQITNSALPADIIPKRTVFGTCISTSGGVGNVYINTSGRVMCRTTDTKQTLILVSYHV